MAPFYEWSSTVSRLQSHYHYEETIYFLQFSSKEFLNSDGWKAELAKMKKSRYFQAYRKKWCGWKYFYMYLCKIDTYLKLPLQKNVVVKLWPLISIKLSIVTAQRSKYLEAQRKKTLAYAVEIHFMVSRHLHNIVLKMFLSQTVIYNLPKTSFCKKEKYDYFSVYRKKNFTGVIEKIFYMRQTHT